ncbi:hypothetical protein BGZ95_008035, partial [Linnemannia exigua]
GSGVGGLGVGQAGGGGGVMGGSFAERAKINVNIRKFVAGIRAKKEQDPNGGGPDNNENTGSRHSGAPYNRSVGPSICVPYKVISQAHQGPQAEQD